MDTLTIATPFFNEEAGLDNYFETLGKIYKDFNNHIKISFLFIDDGSTDSTKQKLLEFKKKNLNYDIKIHFHDRNYGYGKTLQNSIKLSNTKYLITYDSDCSYDYKIIGELINTIKIYDQDIINVSYKLSQDNNKNNLLRTILSWGGSYIYKIFFSKIKKKNITVFTCSFRIYKLEKINKIKLFSEDFNCCAELILKAMLKNLKISEIPGTNIGRKYGYSKMKIFKNIYNTIKTIVLIKLKFSD